MSVRPRPSLEAEHVAKKVHVGSAYALLYLYLAVSQIPDGVSIVVKSVCCDVASAANCR